MGAIRLLFNLAVGYECEEHNNPPDFFLDVINGDTSVVGSQAGRPMNKDYIVSTSLAVEAEWSNYY